MNSAEPGEHNQFPIYSRGARYRRARDRRLRGVGDRHKTLIEEMQPYHRGQDAAKDPLAILNELSNVDKHRVLHAALIAVLDPNPDDFIVEGDATGVAEVEYSSGPLTDGAEIYRIRVRSETPAAKLHIKAPIPMGIGFGDQGLRAEILGNLLGHVRLVLERFRPDFPT